MCKDCGCDSGNWHQHSDGTWHSHSHHDANPPPAVNKKMVVDTHISVLARNDDQAQENRDWFLKRRILCLNLISSPGSGKTLLLEKLLPLLTKTLRVAVLVGDQTTRLDADRLERKGALIRQINTHSSCHLDAPHIAKELEILKDVDLDLLLIENVGNLVCPSVFDLGEAAKIALLSCTEGEEKPLKYPVLFSQCQGVILTKMDLAPHLDWSIEQTLRNIRRLNTLAPIFQTSAKDGLGLQENQGLFEWIKNLREGGRVFSASR